MAKFTKPVAAASDAVQQVAENFVSTTQEAVDKTHDAVATTQAAFDNFREKLEVPPVARDFVQRAASSAKERLADIHATANNATVSYETAVSKLVNESVSALRGVMQASFDNSVATLNAIEKIAAAKSFTEAYQIQTEFARDYASANWARVQNAAETMKSHVQDGVKLFQDEAGKVMSTFKTAA